MQPSERAGKPTTDWTARWQEWRARRWLDRRDRLIADVPSWRLLQELQIRGDLIEATEDDLGMSKGGTGKLRIGARPVDRHGLPLWCEDIGWICQEGDGPPFPYFTVSTAAVDAALEPIYLAWMDEEERQSQTDVSGGAATLDCGTVLPDRDMTLEM